MLLGGLTPPALGQGQAGRDRASDAAPATQPAQSKYWLRVTGESANLRSRPDANSPVVVRVERDAVLEAVDSQFGWHRVLPPAGVFSYAAAAFVEKRSATEGSVAVRSGTLRVRVGSVVQDLDPEKSEVQVLLERGTPVQILGTQGDWLKIVPPVGVYLYVFDQQVEKVSGEVAARLQAAQHSASRPTFAGAGPATRPARTSSQPAGVATTQPTTGPDLRGPWGQRLALVEAALKVEAGKPLLEQTWSDFIARLRPVAEQQAEPMVARLAQAWIRQLEERLADQDAVRAAEEVLRRTAHERAQHQQELEQIERLRQRATSAPAFAARGALARSFAVGQREGGRWYKLLDPLTRRVEVYLEIDLAAKFDPEALLGKYVGVTGARRFEESLGADVVKVETLKALEPANPTTRPTPGRP